MSLHTLDCALRGPCLHELEDIPVCVICNAPFDMEMGWRRIRLDTCSTPCNEELKMRRAKMAVWCEDCGHRCQSDGSCGCSSHEIDRRLPTRGL